MTKRRSILLSVAVVAGGLLWYLFRPDALVISNTVNEPLPAAEESGSMMHESSMQQSSQMAHATMDSSAMGAMDHGQMGDAKEPVKLVSGRFHTNAHETKGVATIYRVDGRRVLRLTDFATSNGPDVRVYLVAAGDVQKEDAAKQAGTVDLGALKGNIGGQNYDVPEGLDLSKYRAVSIWCRRFSVNFGAAPLTAAM